MKAAKVDTKSTVLLVPVQSLPRAELVVMEVSRLRPKGTDECKFETQELLDMVSYLQGSTASSPGVPPMRWPANLGMDFYVTQPPSTILSCKVLVPVTGNSFLPCARCLVQHCVAKQHDRQHLCFNQSSSLG
jgi:hypothetical protein